jgi:hypothetical protein
MERDLDLGFIRLPHEDVPSEIAIQNSIPRKNFAGLARRSLAGQEEGNTVR